MLGQDIDLGLSDIGGFRAIDPGHIAVAQHVGVHKQNRLDAQADELLGYSRTRSPATDDANAELREHPLHVAPERPHLTIEVEGQLIRCRRINCWQEGETRPNHDHPMDHPACRPALGPHASGEAEPPVARGKDR